MIGEGDPPSRWRGYGVTYPPICALARLRCGVGKAALEQVSIPQAAGR